VLTARKSGDGPQDFLKITLKNAFITSISPSAGPGGDVMEQVSLMYKDIEHSYKAQKTAGGALDAEVKTGWDLTTKKTR
jgi:type VI secretion system secreted protein Hcp